MCTRVVRWMKMNCQSWVLCKSLHTFWLWIPSVPTCRNFSISGCRKPSAQARSAIRWAYGACEKTQYTCINTYSHKKLWSFGSELEVGISPNTLPCSPSYASTCCWEPPTYEKLLLFILRQREAYLVMETWAEKATSCFGVALQAKASMLRTNTNPPADSWN